MYKDIFVAEYNFKQGFHHSYLTKSLSSNEEIIGRLIKGEKASLEDVAWIPFAIGTYEETSQAIDNMRLFIKNNKVI